MPMLVVPAVATTANTSVPSGRPSIAAATELPVSRCSGFNSARITSTSITRAAESTDEWVLSAQTTAQVFGHLSPPAS